MFMNVLKKYGRAARRCLYRTERLANRGLSIIGVKQSETKISTDAQEYWEKSRAGDWKSNSHWRGVGAFTNDEVWRKVGLQHLRMFERAAKLTDSDINPSRILEWGCGGGANAIHFAPRASEFIGVDISAESLDECGKQVAAICDTRFTPVEVKVSDPEAALREIAPGVDLFICFYVFECLPSPQYGFRILEIAQEILRENGIALIQVKYQTADIRTRPLGRGYKEGLARMTTYHIETFWELAESAGFQPESIEIVPRTDLDSRYAYYLLRKPAMRSTDLAIPTVQRSNDTTVLVD
jgi:SAM-dependent methyltransferase